MIMGRGSNKEPTPDLFSPEKSGGAPTIQPAEPGINQPSRRAILPKDLPTAINYLDNAELDRLLRAATEEARRRGRLPSPDTAPTKVNPVSGEPSLKQAPSTGRPTH